MPLAAVVVLLACGGAAGPEVPGRSVGTGGGGDIELRDAEAMYVDSVWPVEKHMCRVDIPDAMCREACRATYELDSTSTRLCSQVRGFADDPAGYRTCRESRALAKRATLACSFCSGDLTRRPCHDLF